jgi:hypothetical protein
MFARSYLFMSVTFFTDRLERSHPLLSAMHVVAQARFPVAEQHALDIG